MIVHLATSFLLLISSGFLVAQGDSSVDSIDIRFVFEVDGAPLDLGKPFLLNKGEDTIQIDRLRFYISDMRWNTIPDEKSKDPKNRYHLIDAAVPASLRLSIPSPASISSLHFGFGVDSLTNDAGVHGGDLDPTKGMYWAWQTGYINFKLEGTSSKNCEGFTYHLGGFLNGLNAASLVEIPWTNEHLNSDTAVGEIEVVFEILDFLQNANQTTGCSIMRPSNEAVALAAKFEACLTLRQ